MGGLQCIIEKVILYGCSAHCAVPQKGHYVDGPCMGPMSSSPMVLGRARGRTSAKPPPESFGELE